MACFVVPAAEALVTTLITKVVESGEEKKTLASAEAGVVTVEKEVKFPFSKKMKWLNNMLWGGSALLAFEHLWHGEVAPWFPFLTAAGSPSGVAEMLHEMSTVGVAMAALVSVVWLGMVAVSGAIEKRLQQSDETEKEIVS